MNPFTGRTVGKFSIQRKHLLDLGVLTTVPTLLILLHFRLPAQIQEQLVFFYHNPDPMNAWTAAYFHRDGSHLFGNIVGFFIAIIPAYFLFNYLQRRRQFWISVGVILLLTPLITSIFDYFFLHLRWVMMAEGATSRGFSGIVNGIGGMLLIAVGLFVSHEYDVLRGVTVSMLFVLFGFVLMGYALGALSPLVIALLIIGYSAIGLSLVPREMLFDPNQGRKVVSENAWNIQITLIGGVCAAIFMVTFVPSGTNGGTFSNVIAHIFGFLFGLGATLAVNTVLEMES